MRTRYVLLLMVGIGANSACVKRVPEPAGVIPGTPHVSWVIMHGDRDNPDQEFACQSEPRNECVMPASRPDAQVFSDVHVYYHGAGAETKYTGSFQVGYFQGSPESHHVQTNITVKKNESITNQSVTGIVTSTPGNYEVTFDLVGAPVDTARTQQIRERVAVVIK